ncbi:hypothetical protein [Bacillus sp. JCM 19034]|uniref:hypothetical protein n=1 Tax=Bacillus sp. JCM 19034 TaxID=1481928 RepID=UPI00078667A7|nr:hypothetical protein [Bacillus sp. JCM 19034]
MSILGYEMKKMFLYQKGWLWISIYFVISLAVLLLFDTPKNLAMEMNASSYQYYLDLVRGPQTEEAEQLFANEAMNISEARVTLTKVYDHYYDGKISEEELHVTTHSLEKIVENERGFQLILINICMCVKIQRTDIIYLQMAGTVYYLQIN